jgi:putative transcriptional regulator
MNNRDVGAEILAGLNEIQAFKQDKVQLKTTVLSEPSAPSVIRTKLKLTQSAF